MINSSTTTTLTTDQTIASPQAIYQESASIMAVEEDIQAVLALLPDSEDAEFLQEGLETTLVRLDTATNDQQAQAIIDEEVNKLSAAFAVAPNADRVIDILLDIRSASPAGDFQNGASSTQLQSNAGGGLLSVGLQLNRRSGWLS